jgi:hypothetical protein
MTRTITLLIAYIAMLAFDLAVMAGTAYLVANRDWSVWWFLFALLVCAGSNPKFLTRVICEGAV